MTIRLVTADDLAGFHGSAHTWLLQNQFRAKPGQSCIIPNSQGEITEVLFADDEKNIWSFAKLVNRLPVGVYQLDEAIATVNQRRFALAWALESYRFSRYKKTDRTLPSLYLSPSMRESLLPEIHAIYLTRDLINTPANDMTPESLAAIANELATNFDGQCELVIGDNLLQQNFPAIHAVGRGSDNIPRLIDLKWGDDKHPKVTLVGKGVCFDTGGLDIKSAAGMLTMKKDMGGAAHVLGLAQWIMATKLPIRLRVLIPAVENSIGSNAYRPSDILTMRNGKTVEVHNTDAEGRLVLADALSLASEESPDLLIDFATLTGASRVAVGPDISSVFANQSAMAAELMALGDKLHDPVWQLPLHQAYNSYLKSTVADCQNCCSNGYAGAIVAALFLEQFVGATIPWLHFDIMAANIESRPAFPKGGEAMALRTMYHYLETKFKQLDK